MSIRWRLNGDLVCAAMSNPMYGDTYINDRLHYALSVEQQCLIADEDHENNGLWHWKDIQPYVIKENSNEN